MHSQRPNHISASAVGRGAAARGSFMNMSYACDDLARTYEELAARGVEFEGAPQKQPWGSYAMFKDSKGSPFVLSEDR